MFCENSFCRNLKTNKVKYINSFIFREEISQGIYLDSQIFWLKAVFLRNCQKLIFWPQIFEQGLKEILKWPKNWQKPSIDMCLWNVFPVSCLIFLFLKTCFAPKNEILAKKIDL